MIRTLTLLLAVLVLGPVPTTPTSTRTAEDPASLVNPLIGTANGGNTFPGAVLPFGMFSWSPENTRGDMTRAAAPGGYQYDATRIRGFSLAHLSGTGCRGASGDIPFMPYAGDVTTSPSLDAKNALYASDFSHADERAEAGAYAVTLRSGVRVQLAATARTGAGRFAFPEGPAATMLIRVSDTQVGSSEADIAIDAAARTVTGSVTSGNFCGYLSASGRHSYYTLYFVATFDSPFSSYGTWEDDRVNAGAASARGGTTYGREGYPPTGKGSGGYVTFASGRSVNVRVAISYVSLANARANLKAEQQASSTVETVARAAHERWNEALGRIAVTGGSDAERRVFYTALYHSLLHMNLFSDANGEYRGFDGGTHRVHPPQRAQYANFSGWDVYRSQLQLVALVEPDVASDMAQSLLNQAAQNGGIWDRWTHNSGATSVMEGDPSPAAVAGIAAFGATSFDVKGALASLERAATVPTALDLSDEGCRVMCRGQRPSLDKWLAIHYIPTVSNAWGGAGETLEDATADFALAQLARTAGDAAAERAFLARAGYWRNLFNPAPVITEARGRGARGRGDAQKAAEKPQPGGYIQNRNEDGSWPPLDPASSDGFAEGSAAQYTWMVPFDLAGLTQVLGGRERTTARLDAFFKATDGSWAITRAGGLHADLSNEPSIGSPWTYLYTGAPYKAQEIVRRVLTTLWHDTPDGIPGNDDLGAMSSWYVWASLGLYPGIPGRAELFLAAPLFPHIVIHRANGPTITIDAPGAAAAMAYVGGLRVNGRVSTRAWLPESFPRNGGLLQFVVQREADPAWAASANDAPPSFSPSAQARRAAPTSAAERQAAWAAHQELASSSPFAALRWRALGPSHQAERIEAIAVPRGSRNTIYAGPGAGNVWKSVNNGLTWTPIFDHESAFAIGDVAVASSNDRIVWVGTGEVQPRFAGYAFAGTGVFKSTDAGASWANMGLSDTQHIGKVLIDPTNPDIVYVAAMGHQWTPNADRGVFKTTDGGRTWTKALYLDDRTGAIDLVMNPDNHDVLYASMWQIETGPRSGIYRSTDAGATWTRLEQGLPQTIGRSNIAIARSRPDTVYVFLDNRMPFKGTPADRTYVGGEVYRSDDRGTTWHRANTDDLYPVFSIYGWKFCDIRVSPDNPDEIYILGNRAFHSTDGGRTYTRIGETIRRLRQTEGLVMHLDHHELWIDPSDPNHLLLGNDGGLFASYDRGQSWLHLNTIPLGQFYSVAVDMAEPYNIYGGTQDDAALYGPSTYTVDDSRNENEPWQHVYLDQWTGGDSFVTLPDPSDRRFVYYEHQNGDLRRMDTTGPSIQTGSASSQHIMPRAPRGQPPWRIGWYMPYLISAFDPATLYAGANKLLKSVNRGMAWSAISPDLSDPAGGDRATVPYGTITMIGESPRQRGMLYVGTEGGRIHLTRDDGAHWSEVDAGLPKKWVSRVIASQYVDGTAYVSFTGYREDDSRAYLYRTTDFGATWTSIVNNLPDESINVVREDPRNADVLYVGTDGGVYASLDRGSSWLSLSATLPTTPVHDLVVHPRDDEIVIGTHGRGVFVLDARPIQQWRTAAAPAGPRLFPPHPALVRIADEMEPAGTPGQATIAFALDVAGSATLQIARANGVVVKTLSVQGVRGLNVATWDLLPEPAANRPPAPVQPGEYRVRLSAGGRTVESTLRLDRFVRWRR